MAGLVPSGSSRFEARSSVDYGCSMSVMSYISFAVITANTIININDVRPFSIILVRSEVLANGRNLSAADNFY